MNPGAHLSHAARMAFDAQRALLASALHIEAANMVVADIDHPAIDLPALLDGIGDAACALQHLADSYGHSQVERITDAPEIRRATA